MENHAAAAFSPRIYCIDPTLVGGGGWSDLFARCAGMGFDHVLLCGDGLIAGLFAGEDSHVDNVESPIADYGMASLDQLEELAHLATEHRLRLLLDLSLTSVHGSDQLLRSHPDWFAVAGAASDASAHGDHLPDPRRRDGGACRVLRPQPRFNAPEVAEALLECWHMRLAMLIDAGVAGFLCHDPAGLPGNFWCRLVERTREQRSCCQFLAWTPGCSHPQLESLADCGFDAVFSSGAWWDFRAPWYFREHEKLVAIAPVLGFPEDPFGPRAARVHGWHDKETRRLGAIRALRFAALSGSGWLMPMGFEFGLTEALGISRNAAASTRLTTPQQFAQACAESDFNLDAEVRAANQAMSAGGFRLRAVSAPEAPVLLLARDVGVHQLIAINPRLGQVAHLADGDWQQRLDGRIVDWPPEREFILQPGEIALIELQTPPPVAADLSRRKKPVAEKVRTGRIAIEQVSPAVDGGRFAVKRTVGQSFTISADIFMDGHDHLAAAVLVRAADEKQWQRIPLQHVGNDRWQASLSLPRLGRHYFCIEAWSDVFETYRDGLKKKSAAGLNVDLELEEGRLLVANLAEQALENGIDGAVLEGGGDLLKSLSGKNGNHNGNRLAVLLADDTARQIDRLTELAGARAFLMRSATEYPLETERPAATFSSWYELFPRSQSGDAAVHGTFNDVIARLPAIRAMGFDTLYFPPIHPIGKKNRKGKNNSLTPGDDDPGSPYAIGSEEGGHDAIHPQLGTLDDFLRLRDAAAAHGLELALDFAIQCAPDHPWLKEHPGWFSWRPDGSMRYAENPPKKYQDIVNVDFYAEDAIPDLWIALRDIVLYWVQQGVNVFRVDNPHTKPFPFWEWMIAAVRSRYPQVIFLSEAFTRPKPMYRLAKVGFSQSYTYFTWRHDKREFIDYLEELTGSPDGDTRPRDFFRPHFFVNTPDINPYFLQRSGRAGFVIRAALAATLSGLWGVYSGFELCEAQPVPGKEEYLDSEKYQVRAWDWQRPGNIIEDIARLNRIRRENPALQTHLGVHFLPSSNDKVLYFVKSTAPAYSVVDAVDDRLRFGDNVILVAINLDPFNEQSGDIDIPLYGFGLGDDSRVQVEDLLTDRRFNWTGRRHPISLNPDKNPYGIWRLRAMET